MFLLLAFLLNAWQWHDGKTFQIKARVDEQEYVIPSHAPMNLHPQVAIDQEGNGVAVWDGAVEKGYAVFMSRFDPQLHIWSEPLQLSEPSRTFLYPKVVVQGDLTLVLWEQLVGAFKLIYSSHVYSEGNWRTPVPISSAETIAMQPQLLISPTGRAAAIWIEANKTSMGVYAALFFKESWTKERISSEGRVLLSTPQLSIQDEERILATWKCEQKTQGALFDFSTLEWSSPFNLDGE